MNCSEVSRFCKGVEKEFRFLCHELGFDSIKVWTKNREDLEEIATKELRMYVANTRSMESCIRSCAFQMIYGKHLY